MPRVTRSPADGIFRYLRRVRFGDTDAAGIVYTGRAPDMALEALEVWFDERLGLNWFAMCGASNIDTPCVHLEIDFRSPMTPCDTLDISVMLERVLRSTLQVRLIARAKADGKSRWQSRLVFACVNAKTFKSASVPKVWRPALNRELALTARATPADGWQDLSKDAGDAVVPRSLLA